MRRYEEVDVVKAAEVYFKKFDIRSLLTEILIKLGREQPQDPVNAIRAQLDAKLAKQDRTGPHDIEHLPSCSSPVVPDADEEHDADDTLLQVDLLQLLIYENFPAKGNAGENLSRRMAWAGGFNRSVMENWVPQPSPCCACASVAGAFNALWQLERASPNSCAIREVADLMAANCEQLQLQKQQRLERLLSLPEGAFEEFYDSLDEELQRKGLSWTGRGAKGVTKATAISTARQVANQFGCKDQSHEALSPETLPPAARQALPSGRSDIFEALREVLGEDNAQAPGEAEENEEQEEIHLLPHEGLNWKKELSELLSKRQGVLRLRAERPNTADVGSFGVRQAAEQLAIARKTEPIKVTTLLARKGSVKSIGAPLTKSDTEAEVHKQWCLLKTAFSTPSCVLLFHLTNHYALVFAWREWQDAQDTEHAPCLRRQILTARRGQRPGAWMDFEEVRRILLGWTGYHLLSLRRVRSSEPAREVAGSLCQDPPSAQ
ncbi:Hypothetical protein SCF082_LOCUS12561 [Durusdinium trenchii]|uniref:Uncharacterized protein n=1 Tax=Durusdinium trenchii TaxID=1381693 RepID=A0ABP0JKM9_9DINO